MQYHAHCTLSHRAAEKDLREKLLQEELHNLEATLERIESLGMPIEGIWDNVKEAVKSATNSVKNIMSGKKEVDEVYNTIMKSKKYTNVNINGGLISFTANNKSVQVKEDGNKWHINVDNAGWYPVKNMKDLLIQIEVRTQDGKPELPNSSMQQVMTCSRAILDMRRGGF